MVAITLSPCMEVTMADFLRSGAIVLMSLAVIAAAVAVFIYG
jgi:hypothetical protein